MNDNQRPLYELAREGVAYHHALELIRISRSLRRWFERCCGCDGGVIEIDDQTGIPYWRDQASGRAHRIPDLEKAALRRLAAVMRDYPALKVYIQPDPTGCALYILRPGDLREGLDVGVYYDRGIAVY